MPESNTPNKAQLRNSLRKRRQSLTATEQSRAAGAVARVVPGLPTWREARRIALYLPADGEIDTTPLADLARSLPMQLFLPVICEDNSLVFAEWRSGSTLTPNRYGIPEPPDQAMRCLARDMDILFLPLVGWDRFGGRLGMGGGFYDKTLSGDARPLLVGLAHSCQEVAHIPRESWDIPLDFVATDTTLYCCQGSE